MLINIFYQYCNSVYNSAEELNEKSKKANNASTYVQKLPNGKYKVFSKNTGKSFGAEFKTRAGAMKWDNERRKAYFAQKNS